MILTVNIGTTPTSRSPPTAQGALLFSGKLSAGGSHLGRIRHPADPSARPPPQRAPTRSKGSCWPQRRARPDRPGHGGPADADCRPHHDGGARLKERAQAPAGPAVSAGRRTAVRRGGPPWPKGPAPMAVIFSDNRPLPSWASTARKSWWAASSCGRGPSCSIDQPGPEYRPAAPGGPDRPRSRVGAGQKHLRLPAGRPAAGHRLYAGRPG